MAKTVLLDECHLSVRIPASLPAATVTAARRALNAKAFDIALRRAILAGVGRRPALNHVRVVASR